jgi:hypothetical protein
MFLSLSEHLIPYQFVTVQLKKFSDLIPISVAKHHLTDNYNLTISNLLTFWPSFCMYLI